MQFKPIFEIFFHISQWSWHYFIDFYSWKQQKWFTDQEMLVCILRSYYRNSDETACQRIWLYIVYKLICSRILLGLNCFSIKEKINLKKTTSHYSKVEIYEPKNNIPLFFEICNNTKIYWIFIMIWYCENGEIIENIECSHNCFIMIEYDNRLTIMVGLGGFLYGA